MEVMGDGREAMAVTPLRRRLEQVAVEQHRRQRARGGRFDLAHFTDEELEELRELAHKADTANRVGQPVVWTAEEILLLDRLGAEHAARP
jgi:hypothetical protein